MSRSYKKRPYYKAKDQDGRKTANKKVRRMNKVILNRNEEDGRHDFIQNGRSHRKISNPYDVCEYVTYQSESDWLKQAESYKKEMENGLGGHYFRKYQQAHEEWARLFKRK